MELYNIDSLSSSSFRISAREVMFFRLHSWDQVPNLLVHASNRLLHFWFLWMLCINEMYLGKSVSKTWSTYLCISDSDLYNMWDLTPTGFVLFSFHISPTYIILYNYNSNTIQLQLQYNTVKLQYLQYNYNCNTIQLQ
jgi:hypothetical protein